MTTTTPENVDRSAESQRDALDDAEQKAAEPQPGSYKPGETGAKQVEVPPIDADSLPIQGLDNPGR